MYHGPLDVRVEEVAEPEPGPGEVLVRVARNGICGSDLHTYVGSPTGGAAMHVPGVVLGHEFAGTVTELGDGVRDLDPGTAVAVAPIEWCGACWSCQHGLTHLCRRLALYGGYRRPLHGGLAPFVSVSRRAVFPVPDGLDVVDAALAEPVAVAVHAVRRAPAVFGATVIVLGAGPIGLAILQSVRAAGAATTIVSEVAAGRRAAAAALGATAVIDPTIERARDTVRELTGHGVDLAFDTTGVHAALDDGLACLRPRGTFVSVAGWQEKARFDMGLSMAKELDVRFTMTYEPAVDFPIALELLASRRIDPAVLISDHVPLARVVEDGLEELLHHADRHVKILIDPSVG